MKWSSIALLMFLATAALAVIAPNASAAEKERATLIREGTLYSKPSSGSDQITPLPRGSELTVAERNGPPDNMWLKVMVAGKQGEPAREGWVQSNALVTASTQNAEEIAYGEAVNSEHEAERRSGRRSAAEDAARLYGWTAETFPGTPLAGEALWRAADIDWQIARSRGRKPIDESGMKEVIAKYPNTKWSDLAAYEMIENQLCADPTAQASCAEKNAGVYEQYARQHPQAARAPEALFNAAQQSGLLADIYRVRADKDRSAAAKKKALALAQELANENASEWKARGADLLYKLQQNIALYGLEQEQTEQ
jgi:hypothetical protein